MARRAARRSCAVLVAVDGKPVAEIVRKIEATALRPDEVAFHAMLAVEAALHGAPGATRTLLLLVAQMVDAVADGFRQRIGDGGDRCSRHRLRGLLRQRRNGREQCRGQDGHDGEGRSMCHAGEFQESQARAIFACRS